MTPPDTASAAPRLAGLARRFAALAYEALILLALLLVAGFALVPFVSPGAAPGGELAVPSPAGRTVSFVLLFLLGAVFFGWIWSEGRRTLPMKAWHMTLAEASGRPVAKRTAVVRYLASWIGPALAFVVYPLAASSGIGAITLPLAALNWIAAFVDPERQFLHDRIAGTRLVMASPAPAARPEDATVPRPRR